MNRWILGFGTLLAVVYPWSLPFLATLGFAEPSADSVSGYIANAHATGMMAAISGIPLYFIVRFQESIHDPTLFLIATQRVFLFGYAAFLVCTVTWAPTLHFVVVAAFCVAYVLHSAAVLQCYSSHAGRACLTVGAAAEVCLLFVEGHAFWAVECVGFAALVLFTPLEAWAERREQDNPKQTFISEPCDR